MTVAATQFPLIGSQPIGNFFAPDTTQRHPLGAIVAADDPFWGGGEYIYLKANATLNQGASVTWNAAVGFLAINLPNTANQGCAVAWATYPMTAGQFGWFKLSGQIVANCTASVAAGTTVGITAAGQLGANSAGKQILGATSVQAATATITKANSTTRNGSPLVRVPNSDGLFVGLPISGTGIPASTYIGAIGTDGSGPYITMTQSDLATAQNATATGSITLTGTMNDGTTFYNVLYSDRAFAQGAIT
jgi:hypothetical protein